MDTIIYTVYWETYIWCEETLTPDHLGGEYTTDDWDDAQQFMSDHLRADSLNHQCTCHMCEPFICFMTPYEEPPLVYHEGPYGGGHRW